MRRLLYIVCCWLLLATLPARGQTLSFTHLNTSNGLSGNSVQCLGIDSSGFLWIGTSDGLNSYNGYDITTYYRDQYPGMQSDTIQHLFCDSRNRVWLLHGSAMSMLDEQKKFHPIVLPAGTINNPVTFRSAYETTEYGVVINTTNGIYQYDEKSRGLKEIGWLSEKTGINNYFSTAPLTKDIVVYFLNPHLFIADHRSKKVILEKEIAGIVGACRVDDQHFATITRNGGISIIDRSTGNVQKQFHIYNEVDGVRSTPKVFEMTCTPNGQLAISTGFAGLAMVDIASGAITYFRHDPLDPASISTDILYRVLAGKNGEIITGATNTGVNISNINNQRATYKKIFRDASGNVFDGHSNDMVEDRNGNIWLAGIDRLICWDRKTNRAKFYPYSFNDGINGPRNIEIRTLCIDHKDRIWVGAIGAGVALFDQSTGKFKLISDTAVGGALSDTYINDIMESSDGLIWACSYRGVYTINTSDFKITRYDQHPVLKAVADKVVISLYEDAQQRIWIGTQRQGIFCYDKKNNNIRNIRKEDGLLSNTGYGIRSDKAGNIYVADINGFNVIDKNGKIKNFSRANGMRYHRCESIVIDDAGYAWIANNKCIVRYSPSDNKLEYFEQNAGISMDGFRYSAVLKTKDGQLYFGPQQGINYFDPLRIKNYTAQLRVSIYEVTLPDTIFRFADPPAISANHRENSVQFNFAAINLTGSRSIAYQYMLEGFDKDWQKGNDIRTVRYASLSPGNYTFRVKASIDRVNWTEATNPVSIRIVPPFWKRWWFLMLAALAIAAAIYGLFQFRIQRVRYGERLKTIYNRKLAETEMRALRAQMNPHFIFNCLNSINGYIVQQDHATASLYLTRFSKLIRLILDNSNNKLVNLSSELEALKLYIEMERLRFENKFTYDLHVHTGVPTDSIQVPPLIIQPYVENAIWHGLLHKKTNAHLKVDVSMVEEGMLQCTVEDNGIGREKAKELKSKSVTRNKSLGMKLTEDRIHLLNQFAESNASISIIDLTDEAGISTGTRVILKIPV